MSVRNLWLTQFGDFKVFALMCLYKSIHVGCYEIGDNLYSSILLIISIDRFVVTTVSGLHYRVTVHRFLCAITFISVYLLINYFGLWVAVAREHGDLEVDASCHFKEVVPKTEYKLHLMLILLSGYCSVVCYAVALGAMICRKRFGVLRSDYVLAEDAITYRTSPIVVSSFLLRDLPLTVFKLKTVQKSVYVLTNNSIWQCWMMCMIVQVYLNCWLQPNTHDALEELLLWKSWKKLFRGLLKRFCGKKMEQQMPEQNLHTTKMTGCMNCRKLNAAPQQQQRQICSLPMCLPHSCA